MKHTQVTESKKASAPFLLISVSIAEFLASHNPWPTGEADLRSVPAVRSIVLGLRHMRCRPP